MVMSLETDRAQVLVNGTAVRTLRAGQTSPEGVRLVAADRAKAVLEVDGRTLTLGIGQSTVASVELKADARGHFITTAYINGVPTRALIDTGATSVAISTDDAQRMAIDYAGAPRVQIGTAGGPRTGYRVILATVSVGSITLRNVEGVVMEAGRDELPITAIGMSYLNGVDLRRAGDTLTLTRRNF
ncbi:MAG TPA: TIGR02281 family clan AA aspartic protease [Burkholderiales bacterium]|nr:TIGR02281 family clan AA aspartic protease [Burkholderiales bacterium]